MFTGIIKCLGNVISRRGESEARFSIRPRAPLERPALGESIAVNGVCLTVEQFIADSFTAYASAETLACTTLAALRPGEAVNLEQALCLGSRMGGHMVAGHVDCIAQVTQLRDQGSSLLCRVAFSAEAGHLAVPKGSVALDGVSLTVNACGDDFLEVNIIPETRKNTTIHTWKPGTKVNMETDIIGKYVRRTLEAQFAFPTGKPEAPSGISLDFLRQNGF